MTSYFIPAATADVRALVARRDGETKLGERVACWNGHDLERTLAGSAARFVLFGIPEDIGVRANLGVGGAHTVWEPALKALLNVQSTAALSGEEILVLGAFDFKEWMNDSLEETPAQLRVRVAQIDALVAPLVQSIVAAGKIPLVIGGGHNNSYPLLKGSAAALGHALHCVNLDAHSDYRVMEGRHSGNGFRYARYEGYLDRYAIVGLHENYNSEDVVLELKSDEHIHFSWYEDIFLRGLLTYEAALKQAFSFVGDAACGIELDLDCIEGVLSSAASPSGIGVLQARRYVAYAAQQRPAYLHLTEGAVLLRDGRADASTAKLIAYLLSDFMKACR